MKFMGLILLLFSFLPALAGQEFSGAIKVSGNERILINSKSESLLLYSASTEMRSTILKLDDGDYVTGQATTIAFGRLVVESIDFIGLKKVIGLWKSKEKNLFDFKDFNKLNIWSFKRDELIMGQKATYEYKISPSSEKNSWDVLLAGDTTVYAATLEVNTSSASLTVYDPDSGEPIGTHVLNKLPPK